MALAKNEIIRLIRQQRVGGPGSVPLASSMRAGVCESGDMVGVDMCNRDGIVLMHGHFDLATAQEFYLQFGAALAEAMGMVKQ